MVSLRDKFRGCLIGAAIGDIAGAVVEAESPGYIASKYRSVDEMLSVETVAEFAGPDWRVGRFTDDTQMMLCVAEWLLANESPSAERLLARFADAHEPSRRYGPGTAEIIRIYAEHKAQWRQLSTESRRSAWPISAMSGKRYRSPSNHRVRRIAIRWHIRGLCCKALPSRRRQLRPGSRRIAFCNPCGLDCPIFRISCKTLRPSTVR